MSGSRAPLTDEERKRQITVRSIAPIENVANIKKSFNRHLHYTQVEDLDIFTSLSLITFHMFVFNLLIRI